MRFAAFSIVCVATGAAALLAATSPTTAGEIVFENARLRAVLGEDAVWQSLVDKPSGKDYCAADSKLSFAHARVDGKTRTAGQAALDGDRLTIALAGCDTQLVYQLANTDDWITWKLVEVRGTRPIHVTLVRLPVSITQRVGQRLTAAWNQDYAVCLRGANLQTRGRADRRKGYTELAAVTQDFPGPKLEGACAALLAAPPEQLRPMLQRLAVHYDLVRNDRDGTPAKDLPLARQSYWFLHFAEKDVDRLIEICRLSGFRQVMMSSGSWCHGPGQYKINTHHYPDGIESLRRTVQRLHDEGILVGVHTFSSKIAKSDPYVTPVPDRRFWVDRTATLAADVDAAATEIPTGDDLSQWPGSPVARQKMWEGGVKKHREVILDDEIVYYKSIGPEGKWNTFLGCKRGAWGTRPAAHRKQTECRHYGVDGCINGYIIDLDSTLFEETTSRLAEVFNACDFDLVYFDGSEDVDRRRYDYYAAKAHAVPMRKFHKRPMVHMGGGFHHGLWHSFTHSGTVDTYLNTLNGYILAGGTIDTWPTVRDHIDRSVRYMLSVGDDMIPGELGWFGIWPKGRNTDGLQLDETEYLMGKSLAHNAPISLETSFAQMESHPLTPGILQIVGVYERLRLAGKMPAAALKPLSELGKDFVLLHPAPARPEDLPEFVPVAAVPEVAGGHDLRAMVGPRSGGSVATVWHYLGREGKLTLDTDRLTGCDILGGPIAMEKADGKATVPLDARRTTLLFADLGPEAAVRLLAEARFEARKPDMIWLQAEDCRAVVGNIVKGSQAGAKEPDALGDCVLGGGAIDRSGKSPDYCEYRVAIPRTGRWTLWARVRYPTGGDMSFGLVPAGQEVTLSGNQVLGNCGVNQKQWHWTGRGGGVTTVPPGSPITLSLEAGEFAFRIYPREGGGTAATNPRLDCLLLTNDPGYRPTDLDAKAALDPKH